MKKILIFNFDYSTSHRSLPRLKSVPENKQLLPLAVLLSAHMNQIHIAFTRKNANESYSFQYS